MNYQVVAIGNALVDTEFAVTDELLAKVGLTRGNMTLADEHAQAKLFDDFAKNGVQSSKQSGGGSAANSMAAFGCLGGQAYYHCRVADDTLGNFYLDNLGEQGVATNRAFAIASGVTGTCAVLVSPDGERTMQTHLGTSSEICDENVDFETLARVDWLYLEGYLAMSPSIAPAMARLRQQAGVNGVKIAVSFADPAVVKFAKEGLLAMLGNGVSLIFCNLEEAQLFTEKKQHKACARALLDYAEMAVVTNGGEGAVIATKNGDEIELTEVPAAAVDKVLDTNGAGDNYAGAFLYGLTQSYDLTDCGRLASAVAGAVVQQYGARLEKGQYQAIRKAVLQS